MITALPGVTKPAPGVITTRPATAPEQKPSTVGLPRVSHSSAGQTVDATAVASVVVVNALAAMPQTMCACGKYTTSIHSVRNSMIAEYFMRSAIAPTINAGVMIANISWYIANTFCETQYA